MLQVMTNFNERKDKVDIDLSTNIVESKRSEHTVVLSLKFLFSERMKLTNRRDPLKSNMYIYIYMFRKSKMF